ncbi:MAG: TonB family protein [Gemmatimonadales bacterium]
MIRLFAPPTPNTPLPKNGLTLGNLLFHLAIIAALAAPLQEEVRRALLDREVIYLVPPDEPGPSHHELADASFSSAARVGGLAATDPPAEALSDRAAAGTPDLEHAIAALKPALVTRAIRETAFTELEVDSAVVRDPLSLAPGYPPELLRQAIAGSVTVRYVVDTIGLVDTATYRVLSTTHRGFAQAVREALPGMLFRPAIQKGRRVRQWVEQTFHFRITRRDPAGSSGATGPA